MLQTLKGLAPLQMLGRQAEPVSQNLLVLLPVLVHVALQVPTPLLVLVQHAADRPAVLLPAGRSAAAAVVLWEARHLMMLVPPAAVVAEVA